MRSGRFRSAPSRWRRKPAAGSGVSWCALLNGCHKLVKVVVLVGESEGRVGHSESPECVVEGCFLVLGPVARHLPCDAPIAAAGDVSGDGDRWGDAVRAEDMG